MEIKTTVLVAPFSPYNSKYVKQIRLKMSEIWDLVKFHFSITETSQLWRNKQENDKNVDVWHHITSNIHIGTFVHFWDNHVVYHITNFLSIFPLLCKFFYNISCFVYYICFCLLMKKLSDLIQPAFNFKPRSIK